MSAAIGDTLLDSVVSLTREKDRWIAYRIIEQETGSLGTFTLSYALKRTDGLLPYQPLAVAHLCNALVTRGAAADGSDTGLGKTYHALAAARDLEFVPLILCRVAGTAGWMRACRAMNRQPLDILTWESARTGNTPWTRRSFNARLRKWSFEWTVPGRTLLIFDEAHLGNHDTSLNHSMWIASRNRPSISLSATFADRPDRVSGLTRVLGLFEKDGFELWLKKRGLFVNRYDEPEAVDAVADMKALNRLLYPFCGYRLSYDDPEVKALFPERVIRTCIITLDVKKTAMQNSLYLKMVEEVRKYHEQGKQAASLVADLRYRQAAELMKAEALADLAENLMVEGKSVAIFVNFLMTLKYLSQRLKTTCLIYGNQPDREAARVAFEKDASRVILCMADAGGQSIDLHDIRGRRPRVSLICPTYNPLTLKQVLGRTYRAMTKSTPVMLLVYAAGTVEEKVAENVNRKLANISALNDGDLMEPDLFGLIKGEERNVEA